MDKQERVKWLEEQVQILNDEKHFAAAMGVMTIVAVMIEGPGAERELMEVLARFIRERQYLAGRLN